MKSYKDLIAWQKSMELAKEIYAITDQFPQTERYGLISQMQRAAVSIPSNIAEGSKRNHKLEYLHFLSIASGSAAELETQLLLAQTNLGGSINFDKTLGLVDEVLRILYSFTSAIKKN